MNLDEKGGRPLFDIQIYWKNVLIWKYNVVDIVVGGYFIRLLNYMIENNITSQFMYYKIESPYRVEKSIHAGILIITFN